MMQLRTLSLPRRARMGALLTVAALGAFSARAAQAQIVYDSTLGVTDTQARLPDRTGETGAPVRAVTDDYATTLFTGTNGDELFQLSTLTFYGGVDFTGPANGINNTLVFRFLYADGRIPDPLSRTEVQFAQSGSFLQTVQINALVPVFGFLEVSTLENSDAQGFFALSSGTTVGVNSTDPRQGGNPPVIRAFSLNAQAVAPEPGSMALLAVGALPLVGLACRRRKS